MIYLFHSKKARLFVLCPFQRNRVVLLRYIENIEISFRYRHIVSASTLSIFFDTSSHPISVLFIHKTCNKVKSVLRSTSLVLIAHLQIGQCTVRNARLRRHLTNQKINSLFLEIPGNSRREFWASRFPGIPERQFPVALIAWWGTHLAGRRYDRS